MTRFVVVEDSDEGDGDGRRERADERTRRTANGVKRACSRRGPCELSTGARGPAAVMQPHRQLATMDRFRRTGDATPKRR